MRAVMGVVAVCAVAGCGAEPADPGTDPGSSVLPGDPGDPPAQEPEGACGDVAYADMALVGLLSSPSGQPVPSADVWLEERSWRPTTVHGSGVTDAEGRFSFAVEALPIVEGCWGIGPQFHVVGDNGAYAGEIEANMAIINAWVDGTMVADLSNLPFVLDVPTTP